MNERTSDELVSVCTRWPQQPYDVLRLLQVEAPLRVFGKDETDEISAGLKCELGINGTADTADLWHSSG